MDISVFIPTHNPRLDFMRRVLGALRDQTLDKSRWELALVDNRSEKPIAPLFDLSWHPAACHVREEKLGLTPARLAGIRATRADLVVMVDDDNVLFPDYLEKVIKLAAGYMRPLFIISAPPSRRILRLLRRNKAREDCPPYSVLPR